MNYYFYPYHLNLWWVIL